MSEPSAYEQYMLELVNAARATGGVQPLANNGQLNNAADSHVSWMISNNQLSHTGAGGSSPYDRMVAAGFEGIRYWGENTVWESLRGAAGYTDEVRDLHNWLMNSPGHKANIMNANFSQVGIGFAVGPFQGWQSAVAVQDFAGTSQTFLTGVAYNDLNGDLAYQPGEGLGSLTVMAVSSTGTQHVTQTYGSGGYDLALSAGTYAVTISGSNLTPFTQSVTIGSTNVKLDLSSPVAGPVTSPAGTITGTSGADTLTAAVTTGADTLNGLGGDDRLAGGGGNDLLDGGAGADSLVGGTGSDLYVIDNPGDVVLELAGEGVDLVQSSVSHTLAANVENLTLTGSAGISATGNDLANILIGNSGANFIFGAGGGDRLEGAGGADTLNGGAGADLYIGGGGKDVYFFERGELAGDAIQDFAKGDKIQLHGYSAGSTITKSAGSATDWVVTDGATGATELLKLVNAYNLKSGDFLFG